MKQFIRVGNTQLQLDAVTSVEFRRTRWRSFHAIVYCAGKKFVFYDDEARSLWAIFTEAPTAQQTAEAAN